MERRLMIRRMRTPLWMTFDLLVQTTGREESGACGPPIVLNEAKDWVVKSHT